MRCKIILGFMLIGWAMFTALGGCAHQQNNGPVSPGTGKYAKEISEQKEAARKASKASDRMQAHLKLARLYTSYKNPQRNYKKALKHLEIYASLKSDFSNDPELRNWLSALKQMERQRQAVDQSQQEISTLQKTTMRLKRKNAKLKKINSQLTESNKELTKTIEMLKNIDLNIEEKRRSYSNH